MTARASSGFLYATAVMGVTGARDVVSKSAPELVARVREHTSLPVGVGLGVRSGAQAAELAAVRGRRHRRFGVRVCRGRG